jgi:acetyl-CoA carboxylase carboxyl transferase subunit beta
MSHFFDQRRERMNQLKSRRQGKGGDVPRRRTAKAVFGKCPQCGALIPKAELAQSLYVCPKCGYHHPIGAYLRLSMLLDSKSFVELNEKLTAPNPLQFPGYEEKLQGARKATGLTEGVVTARGALDGRQAVFAVLDSHFLMGSMGVAVGEKVARAVEYAAREKLPLIIFSASGGARMQEGILSLMQMAKTSAALAQFSAAGGFYISVFTYPTTGGVTASFASLGDITLAEPGALIGFAGPRVIQQTIGQTLPAGFQRSEYLEEHGFVDRIVRRGQMRETLSLLLRLHERGGALHG